MFGRVRWERLCQQCRGKRSCFDFTTSTFFALALMGYVWNTNFTQTFTTRTCCTTTYCRELDYGQCVLWGRSIIHVTVGQDSATQNSTLEAIPKMDFLPDLLLTPHKLQHKNASRIKWCEIPDVLLASWGCPVGVGHGRYNNVGEPQNVTSSFSEQDS